MTKFVIIDKKVYSLAGLAQAYNLTPATVNRYYAKGLRDSELLKEAQKSKRSSIKIDGKEFRSKRSASQYYHIPYTTFVRYLNQDKLSELIKKPIIS